jgi:hypothetical protein
MKFKIILKFNKTVTIQPNKILTQISRISTNWIQLENNISLILSTSLICEIKTDVFSCKFVQFVSAFI